MSPTRQVAKLSWIVQVAFAALNAGKPLFAWILGLNSGPGFWRLPSCFGQRPDSGAAPAWCNESGRLSKAAPLLKSRVAGFASHMIGLEGKRQPDAIADDPIILDFDIEFGYLGDSEILMGLCRFMNRCLRRRFPGHWARPNDLDDTVGGRIIFTV
jgi:hypothetical protein